MADEIIRQMDELTERVARANAVKVKFIEDRERMLKIILDKIREIRSSNVEKNVKIESISKELEETKSQLVKINEDLLNHADNGTILQNQIDDLTKENETKKEELLAVRTELEKTKNELGASTEEISNLKQQVTDLERDLANVKSELEKARESHQTEMVRSNELGGKITKIESELSEKYKRLEAEIAKLLNSVEQDGERDAVLKQILDALGEEHEAISSTRDEEVASSANESASSNELSVVDHKTMIELNQAINSFFTKTNGRYILNENALNDPNVSIPNPIVISDELKRKLRVDPERNADVIKKIQLYEQEIVPIMNKTKGGRRKRVTQRKHRRNKKVTRKLIKRRRTQKKRRPIKKRRTARK
jgi:chromosome segregation ATPase